MSNIDTKDFSFKLTQDRVKITNDILSLIKKYILEHFVVGNRDHIKCIVYKERYESVDYKVLCSKEMKKELEGLVKEYRSLDFTKFVELSIDYVLLEDSIDIEKSRTEMYTNYYKYKKLL